MINSVQSFSKVNTEQFTFFYSQLDTQESDLLLT